MGQARRQRRARNSRGGRGYRSGKGRHPAWILGMAIGAALLFVGLLSQSNSKTRLHPTPRATEVAADVLPAVRYAEYARVQEAYQMAAAIPAILDGIYCYCLCSQHSGHYSLLDCFASDHAAGCDICMSEAVLAYQMTGQQSSLDQIRTEIDRRYKT